MSSPFNSTGHPIDMFIDLGGKLYVIQSLVDTAATCSENCFRGNNELAATAVILEASEKLEHLIAETQAAITYFRAREDAPVDDVGDAT